MKMGGAEQGKDDQKRRRGGPGHLGVALAAGIAVGTTGAHAQEDVDHSFESGSYDTSYYSYEMSAPSEEVMRVLRDLDKDLGGQMSITSDQIVNIHSAVDKFVAEHPEKIEKAGTKEGPKGPESYSESSHSPFSELEHALLRGPNINPVVTGVMLNYIKNLRTRDY
jgi:hypothetical protein